MLRKIWTIFLRDVRVNTQDFITLYIILAPVLLAFGINFLTPSINDTTVNLALLDGENPQQIEYLKDFARVEVFMDVSMVQNRVQKRDNIVAILPEGDRYYILSQGNEPESVIEAAKLLKTFYENDTQIEDTTAEIIEFGETIPPIKKLLTNILILMTSVLGGMLISFNIIEEKIDQTIRAINITPLPRIGFVFGKSLIGLIVPVFGTISILWITGFRDVNFGQVILVVFVTSLLSLLIGFIQGINNDDVMSAAGSVKILFVPIAAAIAAVELLNQKWQLLFYWIPFYWTYKGNDAVLLKIATWPQIFLYTGIVMLICLVVFVFLAPKIRKGLA